MAQADPWQATRVEENSRYSVEDGAAPTQFLATRRKAGRYRIHVNVGFRLTEQQLRDYFSQFGPLTDVYLPKHRSGRVKGFGFCTFESEADLNKALQISDHVVVGVLVRINRAGPRPEFISVSKLERARNSRHNSSLFQRGSPRSGQDAEQQGPPHDNRRLSLDSNLSTRCRYSEPLFTGPADQAPGTDTGGISGLPGQRRRSFDQRMLRSGYESSFLQQDQQGFPLDSRSLHPESRSLWQAEDSGTGDSSLSSTASDAWRSSILPTIPPQLKAQAANANLPPLAHFSGQRAQTGFSDSTAAASIQAWQLDYGNAPPQFQAQPTRRMHADSPLLQQLLRQQPQQGAADQANPPFSSQGLGDMPYEPAYAGGLGTPQLPHASARGALEPNMEALVNAMRDLNQAVPMQQADTTSLMDPGAGAWNPQVPPPGVAMPGTGPSNVPSNSLLYQLSLQSSW